MRTILLRLSLMWSTLSVSTRLNSTRSLTSVTSKVCPTQQLARRVAEAHSSHIGYMKKVKETMKAKGASDEDVTAFEKGASSYAKKIVANFKDYEFLIGESMDPDGM